MDRVTLPSLVNNNMSHYCEVLHFVHYTSRTLQKIPPHKGNYVFEQSLSKCLCESLRTKQFLSPNLTVSKNSNFLLLGLTSRKYTKWERMAKFWPSGSHFIIEGLATLREKAWLEFLAVGLKGTDKQQVSPAQKDTKKKLHHKYKTSVGVQVLKPHRWCASQA